MSVEKGYVGGYDEKRSERRRKMTNVLNIGHGLSLTFTKNEGERIPSDVWINFKGDDGKSAAISIAAYAERTGYVIGAGLRSWASDRINEHIAATTEESFID